MSGDIRAALTALVEMYEHNGRCSPIASANGRDYSPDEEAAWGLARAALAAQQPAPLFLLHSGQIDSDGEQDDWDCEADSGKRVEEFCRQHPGQTIGLYASPQAPQAVPQPLTDEQITEMALQEQLLLICDDMDALQEIVRCTERAHGIGAARPQAEQGGAH